MMPIEIEEAAMQMIAMRVLRGDTDGARYVATVYAQRRDGYPTPAERAAAAEGMRA